MQHRNTSEEPALLGYPANVQRANGGRSGSQRAVEAVEVGDLGQQIADGSARIDDLVSIYGRKADRSPRGLRRDYALRLITELSELRIRQPIRFGETL